MARPRKVVVHNQAVREKVFLEIIDHLLRYNDAEKKWIAEQAEVHWGTLYCWCSGNTFSPQIRTLAAVARVLGYELVLKRQQAKPPQLKVVAKKNSKRR